MTASARLGAPKGGHGCEPFHVSTLATDLRVCFLDLLHGRMSSTHEKELEIIRKQNERAQRASSMPRMINPKDASAHYAATQSACCPQICRGARLTGVHAVAQVFGLSVS